MSPLLNRCVVYLNLILFLIACKGDEGAIGPAGQNSLISLSIENAGINCENGGIKIQVGVDKNANKVLDIDEVTTTNYVCNGANGKTSLTTVVTEPKGNNCIMGGVKINSGVDINKNGTLDNSEITTTAYVCNGINGNNALIKLTNESVGSNCKNGGLKIDSGIDSNNNGILDNSEITAIAYVCSGIIGNNTLTKLTYESVGSNCTNGGLKIDSGVDANNSGVLDNSEIASTAYVCNGIDGKISLVNITDEIAGINCPNGGVKIGIGIDVNRNEVLESTEIEEIRYVCNGKDRGFFDKQILLTVWNTGTSGAGGTFIRGNLPRFKINNYDHVDSIAYVVNASNTGTIELFNLTDNISISGSLISANSTNRINYYSQNLINNFPNKEIDIGIKVSGASIIIWDNVYLIIYRSQ